MKKFHKNNIIFKKKMQKGLLEIVVVTGFEPVPLGPKASVITTQQQLQATKVVTN